jgi:hypothetical protein
MYHVVVASGNITNRRKPISKMSAVALWWERDEIQFRYEELCNANTTRALSVVIFPSSALLWNQ